MKFLFWKKLSTPTPQPPQPQFLHRSHGNVVLACAELIVEDQLAIPHTRDEVEQLKATIRRLAAPSRAALSTTALCWLILDTDKHLGKFDPGGKPCDAQRP
jgi:HAMP domain-containing protein